MTIDLTVLANKRDELLLAEVAAWLHDMGKFCNLHIEAHTIGGKKKWSNNHAYKVVLDDPHSVIRLSKAASSLKKPEALNNVLNAQSPKAADFISTTLKKFLQNKAIFLFGESYSLAELIMLGTPGFATNKNRHQLLDSKSGWLAAVLGVCHNEAHVDKEDPPTGQGDQRWPDVFISTAFGYEKQKVVVDTSKDSLDSRLQRLPVPRPQVLEEFSYGVGDTRRPVNEVVLSDWGWMVSALFKPAIAGALITHQQPDIRQWKNWKDKIIDHDLRWRLLRVNFDVLDLYAKAVKIGDLLGYQRAVDEACESVKKLVEKEYPLGNEIYRDSTGIYFTFPDLDLFPDLAHEIRRRVEDVEMELAPRIKVTDGDGNAASEQLKSILGKARKEAQQELKHPFDAQNLNQYWKDKWKEAQRESGKWEVCPVCGLRPKREERDVCATCEKRRKGRMQEWMRGLNNAAQSRPTIWTNEVADKNGRLALLVGEFNLEGWLSGDLVQTMLVKVEQNNPGGCTPKNPSPARLRRVWETTQRFWETALDEKDSNGNPLLPPAPPRLILSGKLQKNQGAPDPQEQPICELLVKGFKLSVVWHEGQLIVCDNPAYFQTTTGKELEKILKKDAVFSLFTSEGYKKRDVLIGKFTIEKVEQQTSYAPFIPILAEPQIFMALVPADKSLEIIKRIKEKYEQKMGKVRNRLSLHLACVYARRHTPVRALLDAGRAMLKIPPQAQTWKVKRTKSDGQTLTLELENKGRQIDWHVPLKMGDGVAEDQWYPYAYLEADAEPSDRPRRFQSHNPWTKRNGWLVHAGDLKEGDSIFFTPFTFDFEFLDTTARRFEIYYDENCRRPRRTRPFYLEDLDRLEETDEVFKQFVADTLAGAEWPKDHPWAGIPQEWRDKLVQAGVRGELADLAELHMEILKEKE